MAVVSPFQRDRPGRGDPASGAKPRNEGLAIMAKEFFIYTTKAGKKLRAILLTDLLAKAGIPVPNGATPRAFIGGSDTDCAGKVVVTYGEAEPVKTAPTQGPAGPAVSLADMMAQLQALMAAQAGNAPAGRREATYMEDLVKQGTIPAPSGRRGRKAA